MSHLEEITAVFLGERIRWDETIIGSIWLANGSADKSLPFDVKGKADVDELQQHQTYRFYGRWTTYKNKRSGRSERQFHFQTFVRAKPYGRSGVIAYLRAAGKGNGIGTVRATKLWEKFGSDAVRILREQPEVAAAAISGLSIDQAKSAAEWLEDEKALEGCTIELTDLLANRGLPRETARKAIKLWGNRAAELIRRDPYSLMSFRGCGFKRCDAMWLDLGLPPERLRRQALCAWYAIASNTEGHTWYPVNFAIAGLQQQVGGAKVRPLAALKLAKRIGKLSLDRNGALTTIRSDDASGAIVDEGGSVYVAEGRKADNERRLAEMIVNSQSEVCDWEQCFGFIERFPGYRATVNGEIESCWSNNGKQTDTWKPLKTDEINGGYLRVRLRTGTLEYEAVQVSHFVLEAFVGERPDDCVACHGDSNPKNNSIENLRWDSRHNNEEDKRLNGTHQTGSKNPAAKLTEDDVIEIRRLHAEEGLSTYKLSDRFGVSRPVIGKIIRRELWRRI